MKTWPVTCSFPWLLTLSNLYLPHNGLITFARFVGVSGGGIQLNVDGITSLTDAGAAGRPIFYDSVNNRIGIGGNVPETDVNIIGNYIRFSNTVYSIIFECIDSSLPAGHLLRMQPKQA
jgi:hypothetical protein